MNVYVETNFIIELALKRNEYPSCESILNSAISNRISLLIPSLALVESFSAIYRRTTSSNEVRASLQKQRSEARRSGLQSNKELEKQIENFDSILANVSMEEDESIQKVFSRVGKVAEIIEMEHGIIELFQKYSDF